MAITSRITDSIIQNSIHKAVANVCHIMIKHDATFVEKASFEARANQHFEVLGTVGFVGDICGVVYLCLSADFARQAASHMLGMSVYEIDAEGPEVIKDAIGEITNMTVGGFKNALCDLGFPCKLTLPTIARGTNLRVATIKETERHIFLFQCAGHELTADIQLRAG